MPSSSSSLSVRSGMPSPSSSLSHSLEMPSSSRSSRQMLPRKSQSESAQSARPSPSSSMSLLHISAVGPVVYPMANSGAAGASPLYDSAVRRPEPSTMMAKLLPLAQPERLTISWIMVLRSEVWYLLLTVQAGRLFQLTEAEVFGRLEIFWLVVVKVAASSAAWPLKVREVASDWASSASNSI